MSSADPVRATDSIFEAMRFRFEWREYQARALREFDRHLADRRFHLVAAPGSGKTVLGLEVIRRLGLPTLVLAPSLAVREQWISRLTRDFLGAAAPISRTLGSPAELTFSTYQALAAAFDIRRGEGLLDALRAAQVGVLVVNEAHHLRRAWWRTLRAIEAGLPGVTIVALTATPPYDVPQAEWNRYASFCGPIDEEVGVPELVATGDLCPHQDYVHLSRPTADEREVIDRYAAGVRALVLDLELDIELAAWLAAHPMFSERRARVADTEFHLAVALYLRQVHARVPRALLDDLDIADVALPPMDLDWHQALLQGLLFDSAGELAERAPSTALSQRLERHRRRLQQIGAVERRRVALRSTRRTRRLLRASLSKLHSIAEIAAAELANAPESMRLAVLTDTIRESEFPRASDDPMADARFAKIGVVPIFETLRRLRLPGIRLAVACGGLTIVPTKSIRVLRANAAALGISRVHATPLAHARDHLRLQLPADRSVALLTGLLELGEINTVVGTASLLGEGWDVPCLNTLILASAIGSHVGSNQMRGRAIRVDPRRPAKVANIWHLACLEPDPSGTPEFAGRDWEALQRRFASFPGLSAGPGPPRIEYGADRLGFGTAPPSQSIETFNRRTRQRAERRDQVLEQWRRATCAASGRAPRPIRELRVHALRLIPRAVVRLTERPGSGLWGWLERRWRTRRLRQIARIVLSALRWDGIIEVSAPGEIATHADRDGNCRVGLHGARPADQARFIDALAQVFDVLDEPRYLIARGDRIFGVPEHFARNRDRAEAFFRSWSESIRGCRLVFSQSDAGARVRLRAKRQALIDRFAFRTPTAFRWG